MSRIITSDEDIVTGQGDVAKREDVANAICRAQGADCRFVGVVIDDDGRGGAVQRENVEIVAFGDDTLHGRPREFGDVEVLISFLERIAI